ncbi:MAG TPA: acyl-CoA desaturase, partial [Acidobacteriota bacterium]|nr:acyl-CoA desaturase [Acidobacteriota bacterium]
MPATQKITNENALRDQDVPSRDPDHHDDDHHDDIVYPDAIPFVLVHLACFGAIWTGVTWEAVAIGLVFYFLRMWAITAGFHRYFAHKSYRTSRVGQFILAFLGQSSAQKGVIWWAAQHRHHHKYSDMPLDIHSPVQHGFFFSHVGWIFARKRGQADYSRCKDLTKYPELVWLDKLQNLPALVLAVAALWIAGWPGLVVGFFWSTVVLYHATFCINSLAHVHGKKRYITGDDSRNNWWLALLTMGEGWHNNHHYYQSSTKQGFRWYEIDLSYYVLKVLSWMGIVWGLRKPPANVVAGERPVPTVIVDRVAHELAATFSPERISSQIAEAWQQKPSLSDLRRRAAEAQKQASEYLAEIHLPEMPQIPSLEEFKRRAEERFAYTPSLDDIAERAY